MGTISKDTFKRLYLLYTIGRFKEGVYGLLRLNKVVYFGLKDAGLKAFGFKLGISRPKVKKVAEATKEAEKIK